MKDLLENIKTMTTEELKKTAITLKDDISDFGIIVADKVNDALISKMGAGEFEEFCNNELW